MRFLIISCLLLASCMTAIPRGGRETVHPTLLMDQYALKEIGLLESMCIGPEVDYSKAKIQSFNDDRYVEERSLGEDFNIGHLEFYSAYNHAHACIGHQIIEVISVTGKYSEMVQAEQITPAFWLTWKWKLKGQSEIHITQGFGFGNRFDGLIGSANLRRKRELDAAGAAYETALYRLIRKIDRAEEK